MIRCRKLGFIFFTCEARLEGKMRCAEVARMLAEGATVESGWKIVTMTRGYTRVGKELEILG